MKKEDVILSGYLPGYSGLCNRLFEWEVLFHLAKHFKKQLVVPFFDLHGQAQYLELPETIVLDSLNSLEELREHLTLHSLDLRTTQFIIEEGKNYITTAFFDDFSREILGRYLVTKTVDLDHGFTRDVYQGENVFEAIRFHTTITEYVDAQLPAQFMGVHIRLGDYITEQHPNFVHPDYFLKQIIRMHQIYPGIPYLICIGGHRGPNEDRRICRDLARRGIPFFRIRFQGQDENFIKLAELYALSRADRLIASRSTFSMVAWKMRSIPYLWPSDADLLTYHYGFQNQRASLRWQVKRTLTKLKGVLGIQK